MKQNTSLFFLGFGLFVIIILSLIVAPSSEFIVTIEGICHYEKTPLVEVDGVKYYTSCLKNFEVVTKKLNRSKISLKEALMDKKVSVDTFRKKSSSKKSYLDGGTVVYTFSNFKMISCNHLKKNGTYNKDVIFVPKAYKDPMGFCS